MRVALRLSLVLIAAIAMAGCRAAGVAPTGPTPPPEPKLSFRFDDFVREHNQNARLIKTVDARPSIQVTMALPDGEEQSGGVNGRLKILQPTNFKLEVATMTTNLADIGSNDEQFWFWIQDRENKHVYFCDYADLPASEVAPTYQPDWIVRAMGLKPITPDEAAVARVSPGPEPGTTLIRFPASRTGGASFAREIVVADVTNRVTELRVFDRDGKTLIGHAEIESYRDIPLPSQTDAETEAETETGGTEALAGADRRGRGEPKTLHIPDHLVLKWKREGLTLDITLPSKSLTLNQPISEEKRAALFVQPKFRGYTPFDLAAASREQGREIAAGGEVSVRETLPAPEPRDRVRLGAPVEIQGGEPVPAEEPKPLSANRRTSSTERPGPKPARPQAPAADPVLLPVFEEVVGPATPRPPASPFRRTATAGELSSGLTLDR